jgi:Ion channel
MIAISSILELVLYFAYFFSFIFALFSKQYIWMILVCILCYLVAASLNFHQLINWIKIHPGIYRVIAYRFLFFHGYSIVLFATVYFLHSTNIENSHTFLDALYFSVATWTTLGYANTAPIGFIKLVVSVEAISGIVSFAILAALVWFALQRAFEQKIGIEQAGHRPKIRLHEKLGFVELRNGHPFKFDGADFFATPCTRCGSDRVSVYRIHFLIHEIVPFPRYVAYCENCERVGAYKLFAVQAARWWNRKNK